MKSSLFMNTLDDFSRVCLIELFDLSVAKGFIPSIFRHCPSSWTSSHIRLIVQSRTLLIQVFPTPAPQILASTKYGLTRLTTRLTLS